MRIDVLFSHILNMSLTASIVIAFVLLARLMLKRAPKIFSYALWAIVLFRLLCPVSLPSPISVLNMMNTPVTESGSIEYISVRNEQMVTPQGDGNIVQNTSETTAQTVANSPLSLKAIVPYIWLIGIAVMLIYSAISLLKLRHKLIGATPLRDNIYLADHISFPFVIGLFSPRIYLPSFISENEQDYIIKHEQHHIRRFDYIVKILAFVALCLHWFNPLVWAAFILAGNDMEMSCDEAVMKQVENDIRADYSSSLLSFSTGKKMISGTPLAFGEGNTKGRIKNVMNYKKPAFWVVIVAIIGIGILAVTLISNPKGNDKKTTPEKAVTVEDNQKALQSFLDYIFTPMTQEELDSIFNNATSIGLGVENASQEQAVSSAREKELLKYLTPEAIANDFVIFDSYVLELNTGYDSFVLASYDIYEIAPMYFKCKIYTTKGDIKEINLVSGSVEFDDKGKISALKINDISKSSPEFDKMILKVNDKLYYGTDEVGPMGDAGSVEGKIQSWVKPDEIPTKNGASNFGCIGNPYTYDFDDEGEIMVLLDDLEYHIFRCKE